MLDPGSLAALPAARVFDGGDLDCGSGLVLLIRENMLQVPPGGILEMRSREPTVADDLPPWCRMVGHEYLGVLEEAGTARYFIRRAAAAAPTDNAVPEEDALARDLERAKGYEWRLRVRATGPLRSTVYCRNFSFDVGQPVSFEEKDRHPAAIEYLLGAVGGELACAFSSEAARSGLRIDDIEITLRGSLVNVLAHLGLEPGDPAVRRVEIKCFTSTLDDEERVKEAWERTVSRSPLVATLRKAAEVDLKLAIA